MGTFNHKYIRKNNWVCCDICGINYRASKMRTNYRGLMVCQKDFEYQHPQEIMVEAKAEKIVADKVRVEPAHNYINNDTRGFDYVFDPPDGNFNLPG